MSVVARYAVRSSGATSGGRPLGPRDRRRLRPRAVHGEPQPRARRAVRPGGRQRRRPRAGRAAGWRERRDPRLRLADWGRTSRRRARSPASRPSRRGPARRCCSPWARTWCRGDGRRRPAVEPRTYRFVRKVRRVATCARRARGDGRRQGDRRAARADLEDEILATAVGQDGDIESAMFRIVGIVATGSEEIDVSICQVVLADVERLTGLAGAGEVTSSSTTGAAPRPPAARSRRASRRATRSSRGASWPRSSRGTSSRTAPPRGSSARSSCSSSCSAWRAPSSPRCSSAAASSRSSRRWACGRAAWCGSSSRRRSRSARRRRRRPGPGCRSSGSPSTASTSGRTWARATPSRAS